VQAQILNLLRALQDEFNLTYVFISHDLSVMRQICTRIAVMYLGRIVELAESETIFEHPRHPYTALLISAVPRLSTNGKTRERVVVGGDVPSPIDPPSGCVFHPRCPRFHEGHCDVVEPELAPAPGDFESHRGLLLPARIRRPDRTRDARPVAETCLPESAAPSFGRYPLA
jgi:oligopeptide/dipeptide ABC transporter ATP-binding protein